MKMIAKIKKVLPPSILLSLNLFVFGPFTIYQGNANEFDFGFIKLLGIYVLPIFVSISIALFVGILHSGKKINIYISLLFGLGLLFWFQASFLVWDYGVFDARGINWAHFSWQGWLDISIWFLFLTGVVIFSRQISKLSSIGSFGFIILQLIVVLSISVTSEEKLWIKKYEIKDSIPERLLEYSSSQNIVHIILDSFQTDIFMELVEEEGWKKDLEGFIIFKENMGVSPHTTFSLPVIFSGEIYDGKVLPATYYKQSIKEGFQNRLYDEGFSVNLVPEISMRDGKYTAYYPTPNIYKTSIDKLLIQNAAYLFDVVLFRQSPHFIRKNIYNKNNWLVSAMVSVPPSAASFQQKAFFHDYIQRIKRVNHKPAYHFIHLMPPHPPYVTNKDGSYAGKVLPITRENYKSEAKYILKLFVVLVNKLKELEIYDSSFIILQGDHGSQIPPIWGGRTVKIGIPRVAALLTIKPPHNKGESRVSNVKTSILDIPATIMDVLDFKHTFQGTSVFKIDPYDPRKRLFIVYSGKERGILKYQVSGSIFNVESWDVKKKVLLPKDKVEYKFGTLIQFGMSGNADPFMGSGWSSQHSSHAWNNGHSANLKFVVDIPDNNIIFEARFIPFIHPGKVKQQRIYVSVNGKRINEWIATERKTQTFQATITKDLVNSRNLLITFDFPDAVSPKSIDVGGDPRTLSIAIISARLDQR